MAKILIVLGILGTAFGFFSYSQNRHIKENRQKSLIISVIFIIVFIVGMIMK